MTEFIQPVEIGEYKIFVRFIGKSADLPEQFKYSDIIKNQSIKFEAEPKDLLNPSYEPWVNLRVKKEGILYL